MSDALTAFRPSRQGMEPASVPVRRFVRWSGVIVGVQCALRGIVRSFPFVMLGLVTLGILDHWLNLPPLLRQGAWIFLVAGGLLLFASGFWPTSLFTLRSRSECLSRRAGAAEGRVPRLRSDDLKIAFELAQSPDRPGTSAELVQQYLVRMTEGLRNSSLMWCFPGWRWKAGISFLIGSLIIAAAAGAMLPTDALWGQRLIFPFVSSDWEKYLKIEPGNAEVPAGESFDIKITLKAPSASKPVLYLRVQGKWESFEPAQETAGTRVYRLKGILEPLQYRVRWNDEWSRKFTMLPIIPLRLETLKISIKPPDYVRKPSLSQSSPEISGLPGSEVTLEATASGDIRSARISFSDGRVRPADQVMNSRQASFHFLLDKSVSYSIQWEQAPGVWAGPPEKYPIRVIEDQPPTVTLLSPDQDLTVGEREKIPLTFSAKDDFGVAQVDLVWRVSDKRKGRRRIRVFDPPADSALETFSWNLGAERFQPGDVIIYQIEAFDGNRVTGPGSAMTPSRQIEIASFEKEHQKIEAALDEWRSQALNLLAQVNTVQGKVKSDKPDWSTSSAQFTEDSQSSKNLEASLKRILGMMENDPMADYKVWTEHKAMAQNLSALNQGTFPETQAALETQNQAAANSGLQEISAELERMTALSDELKKEQRARDLTEEGNDLERVGEELADQLSKASEADPKLMSEIKSLVSQAEQFLQQMAQSLRDMPQELPEDFVNQQALKEMNFGQAQDLLKEINEDLKNGRFKDALQKAQAFLRMAKAMSQKLGKAHDSFEKDKSVSDLEKKIEESEQQLEQIAERQRTVLARTQKLDSKRLEKLMSAEKDLLAALAKRQRAVLQSAQDLLSRSARPDPRIEEALGFEMPAMEAVGSEFEAKRIEHSLEWLTVIDLRFRSVEAELAKSTVPVAGLAPFKAMGAEERSILSELKEPPQENLSRSSEDAAAFGDLQKSQDELAHDTDRLRQQIQTLSRRTASLGVSLSQSLSKAGADMGKASGELGGYRSQPAEQFEESALAHLHEADQGLQGAQGEISDMAAEEQGFGGGGQGGVRIIRRGASGGRSSFNLNRVKIPTSEDYRPPKEFREELLESLKEKYPKTYEKIIQDYYKRLAE